MRDDEWAVVTLALALTATMLAYITVLLMIDRLRKPEKPPAPPDPPTAELADEDEDEGPWHQNADWWKEQQ